MDYTEELSLCTDPPPILVTAILDFLILAMLVLCLDIIDDVYVVSKIDFT